jgi:Domain of unknown function (DUF4385)
MAKFNYNQNFKTINFRDQPELYQVGVGEQGVLLVEPYKSELLPHWRFRTPEVAKESSQKLYDMFLKYKQENDFVGMDMARKFLQMGWTRSRRYANHKTGRKWNAERSEVLALEVDEVKAASAAIFYEVYVKAREDNVYQQRLAEHRQDYEGVETLPKKKVKPAKKPRATQQVLKDP